VEKSYVLMLSIFEKPCDFKFSSSFLEFLRIHIWLTPLLEYAVEKYLSGSVLPHIRFCICILDYDYLWHIVDRPHSWDRTFDFKTMLLVLRGIRSKYVASGERKKNELHVHVALMCTFMYRKWIFVSPIFNRIIPQKVNILPKFVSNQRLIA
jgi:hypothetical protein